MASQEVGSGHYAVIPTFKGFRRAVDREASSAGQSGARGFSRAMGKGGDVAGGLAGRGFARGFQKSSSVSSALKDVQREVRSSAQAVSKARLQESDAAGKVRVAEAQLAEARSKHAAGSSQVVRAEERLSSAQRGHLATQGRLTEATGRLTQAQKTLTSAQAGVGRTGSVWSQMSRDLAPARAQLNGAVASMGAFVRTTPALAGVRSAVSGISMAWTRASGVMTGIGPVVLRPLGQQVSGVAQKFGTWASDTVKRSPLISTAVSKIGTTLGRTGTVLGSLAKAGGTAARGIMTALGPVGGQIASTLGRGFTTAVGAAGRAASSIGSSFANIAGAGAAAGAAAIGVAFTKGLGRLTSIDQARAKLTGLGNDGATVAKIMGNATASVKGTAFGLGEASTVAAGAVAAGIKPGEKLQSVLKGVANVSAATGRSMEDTGSIFNNVAANQKAYTMDIKQLAGAGLPMWDKLGEVLGKTQDEVRKMASDGEIDFDTFSKAAALAAGTVADEMGKTVPGAIKNLGASVGRIGANIFGGISSETGELFGLYSKFGPLIASITASLGPVEVIAANIGKWLDEKIGPGLERLTEKFNTFGKSAEGGTGGLASKLSDLAPMFGVIAAAALPLMAGFLSKLPLIGGLFAGLGPGLMGGLMPLVAGGGLIAMLAMDPAQFSSMITGLMSSVVSGMGSLLDSVGSLLATLVPAMVENLTANAPVLAEGFLSLLLGLADAVTVLIPMLVAAVVQLIPALVTALVSAIPSLIQGGIALLLGIVQGLTSAIPLLVTALVGAIPLLVTGLVSAIPQLMAGALQLFLGLVQGLSTALPQILTAVIAAVPVLIDGLVSQIPSLIAGAISLFLGIIDGLGQAIPAVITAVIAAVPQLISALVSALPQLITGAMQLFLGIVSGVAQALPAILAAVIGMIPQIVSSIVGAVPQLLQAGADLIAGLVQGIANAGSLVMDAIGGVVDGAINWAKQKLGIKSPSRVFKKIGDWLGQGFAVGVLNSADKVRSATDKLVGLVKDQFDKLSEQRAVSLKREKDLEAKRARERDAAGKKVAGIENKLINLDAQRAAAQQRLDTAKTSAARDKARADLDRVARNRKIAEKELKEQREIAKNGKLATRQKIWDERATGRALDALRKTDSKKLIAHIKAQEKIMADMAAAREKVAARLAGARDALSDAIKVRDDWAADIRSQVSQLGALAGRTSVGSMTGNLQAQIESAKEFQSLMSQLMKDGLDKASVEELTAAFAQDGSLATVRALAAGGKGAVSEIGKLREELNKVAGGIGKTTGTNLYQAGVDAAQGLVKGLESQAKALETAAKKLSDALVKSVKKALGIKSPSRRFRDQVGKMVPLGVLDGMTDRSIGRRLDRAAADLVPHPARAVERFSAAQARMLTDGAGLGRGGDSVQVVVEGDATPETAYEIARRTRMELKRRRVVV